MQQLEQRVEASLLARIEQLEAVVRVQADTIQQLQRVALPKQSGLSCTEARAVAGLNVFQARAAGYTLEEIKAAGYVEGLKAAGYTCVEARAAVYTCQEARAAGYTCQEAKAAGFTCVT